MAEQKPLFDDDTRRIDETPESRAVTERRFVELPPARVTRPPGATIRLTVPHVGQVDCRFGQCSYCGQGRTVAVKATGRHAMPEIRICQICAREIEAALWSIDNGK